ncbi:MAG: hypothetical protein PUB22_06805 [Clostridiales bacterium]|nr:hypothetical protein [Clostridiales bacterium]
MEIKAPNETSFYSGNGKDIIDFTLDVPESGVYTIVVEARHSKGRIEIQKNSNNS